MNSTKVRFRVLPIGIAGALMILVGVVAFVQLQWAMANRGATPAVIVPPGATLVEQLDAQNWANVPNPPVTMTLDLPKGDVDGKGRAWYYPHSSPEELWKADADQKLGKAPLHFALAEWVEYGTDEDGARQYVSDIRELYGVTPPDGKEWYWPSANPSQFRERVRRYAAYRVEHCPGPVARTWCTKYMLGYDQLDQPE